MTDKLNDEEFQELLIVLKDGMEAKFAELGKLLEQSEFVDQMLGVKQQQNFFDACDRQMEQLVGTATSYRWDHPEAVKAPLFEVLRELLDRGDKPAEPVLNVALRPGERTLFGKSVAVVIELADGRYVWHDEVDELLSREAHGRAMAANALEELARGLTDPEAKATALLAAHAHRDQAANPTLLLKVLKAKSRGEVAEAICQDKSERSEEAGLGKMMELLLSHPITELRQEMQGTLSPAQFMEAEKVMRKASESCKPHISTFLRNLLMRWKARFS